MLVRLTDPPHDHAMKHDGSMKIEKVDAHHHLWTLGTTHYPLLSAPDAERFIGNTGRLKHDFDAPRFMALAAAQNVTRSVYVESHFAPSIEETAYVQRIADVRGFPHAILGSANLASPSLASDLDIHLQSRLFRGLRAMVNWDDDPRLRNAPHDHLLRDADWRAGYREIGRRGLVLEVMALPAQLADLASLAEAEPSTRLVVGHAGMPLHRNPAEAGIWRAGLTRLAALPHVTIKISGLGMCNRGWTIDSIRPLVAEVVAQFGATRCMFASNFPVDGLYSSYDVLWDAFEAITADYAPGDRDALFRTTALRVFSMA